MANFFVYFDERFGGRTQSTPPRTRSSRRLELRSFLSVLKNPQ